MTVVICMPRERTFCPLFLLDWTFSIISYGRTLHVMDKMMLFFCFLGGTNCYVDITWTAVLALLTSCILCVWECVWVCVHVHRYVYKGYERMLVVCMDVREKGYVYVPMVCVDVRVECHVGVGKVCTDVSVEGHGSVRVCRVVSVKDHVSVLDVCIDVIENGYKSMPVVGTYVGMCAMTGTCNVSTSKRLDCHL